MKIIVAVDQNYAIGFNGKMLFSLPKDLAHFQKNTLNQVVVMGRKTLDSLPGSKPLKNRTNIVLSRDTSFSKEGVEAVHSYEELFDSINKYEKEGKEVFVIGGSSVYTYLLDYCSQAVITHIHAAAPMADSYFPSMEEFSNWEKLSESDKVLDNNIETSYVVYINKKVKPF